MAHTLREEGFNAFVIVGGLAAWRKAGRPTEKVPESDLVHLPTFSRGPVRSDSRTTEGETGVGAAPEQPQDVL